MRRRITIFRRRISKEHFCASAIAAFPFKIRTYRLLPHCGAVRADGIASSNTVGYTSQEVKAGQFYMVGVQFADVDARADVANFNNFFATTCAPGEYGDGNDASMNNAPQIQVLNASGIGYKKYYYISDAYDADDNPVEGNYWADDNGISRHTIGCARSLCRTTPTGNG